MKDAFGNEVKLGNIYCAVSRNSGVADVYICKALKINPKTVALEVLKHGRTIYTDDMKQYTGNWPILKINLISNCLIPFGETFESVENLIKW